MAPVKTRSKSSKRKDKKDKGYKADPEDTNDDDDFYGMRELKHQLAGLNLQLKDTMGDGNCLFRACADQYYGTEQDHAALRAEVCQYIEQHAEHFKPFLDNVPVEAHVAQMRKNGTYGGNIELVAFARMKHVDIKVYQPGYIYVIEGVDVKKEGSSPGQRPFMHIAGPHEGLPEINPTPTKLKPLAKLTAQDPPRSIERQIMKVSGVDDLELVRELLEKYRGDADSVYNDLAEKSFAEANGDNEDAESTAQNATEDVTEDSKTPEGESEGGLGSTKEKSDAAQGTDMKSIVPEVDKDEVISLDSSSSLSSLNDSSATSPISSKPSSRPQSPAPTTLQKDTPPASACPDNAAPRVTPKKRMSGRDKKELAKRNQKLNRKMKGKHEVGSDSGSSRGSESNGGNGGNESTSRSSNMRELFV
ncbi:hypothetical protein BGZ58_010290 [Dissophora ornata]|nr:hypothetical protein BGZ58_010290 [Dissophora ornata]